MKKYMIFGAGNIGAECLEYHGDKVVGGFIDNDKNKQGKLYKGKKVIDLDTYKNDFSDYTIVVATNYADEISKQLTEQGIKEFVRYSRITESVRAIIISKLSKLNTSRITAFGIDDYSHELIEFLTSEINIDKIAVPDGDDMVGNELCGFKIFSLFDSLKDTDVFIISSSKLHAAYRIMLQNRAMDKIVFDPFKYKRFFETKNIVFSAYTTDESPYTVVPVGMREAVRNYVNYAHEKTALFETIEIETYNRCNGICSFCPVNKKIDPRKETKMTQEMFENIINQLSQMNYCGRIALFSNNEPLLDDRIFDFHKYAREHLPNAKMHLFTNGTLLTVDKFVELMKYLDELIIDNYHQELKLIKPCEAIKEYVESHPELRKKVTISLRKSDEVLTSRGGYAPNKKPMSLYAEDTCALPFEQLIIRPDGKISLCCNDPLGKSTLGDLNNESILDAWYGEKFRTVRDKLFVNRSEVAHCKFCDVFYVY